MSQRQARIDRIVAVEREYWAASVAVDLLQKQLDADPAFLSSQKLRSRDARSLRSHLEGTYVIRLCAEFEGGLRDAWANAFGRQTQPPLRDLLVAIAARRLVPQLRRLKAFELLMASVSPRFHRHCRRVYDRVAPKLAAAIVHPLLADVGYLILKPAEWVALACLALAIPGEMTLVHSLYRGNVSAG